jgi:hypothetical protein
MNNSDMHRMSKSHEGHLPLAAPQLLAVLTVSQPNFFRMTNHAP